MLKKIAELEEKASREIEEAKNMEEIKALKVRYFGKKRGLNCAAAPNGRAGTGAEAFGRKEGARSQE